MPRGRTQATTFSGMALLATVVGVGVMAVVNLAVGHADPAAVVARQQERLAELGRQAEALAAADGFADSERARSRLGRAAGAFDRTQAALIRGGVATDEEGRPLRIDAVGEGEARQALQRVSVLWLQMGPPLAELAAGAYSVHGAAGRQALAPLHMHGPTVAAQLTAASAVLKDWRPPASWAAVAAGLVAAGVVLIVVGVWGGSRSAHRRRQPALDAAPRTDPEPDVPAAAAVDRPQTDNALATVDRLALDIGRLAVPQRRPAAERAPLVAFRDHVARDSDAAAAGGGTLLLRGANHAASYTTMVALELAECVRDAAKLTDRVAQLSRWTGEAADQLGAQSLDDGPADAAAAEAAARKVSELAARTSETAAEIEHTVSVLLCRTREYEEAVGRILGHVSAIHRSTRRLGQVLGKVSPTAPTPARPAAAAPQAGIPTEATPEPETLPAIRQFQVPPGDEEPEPTAAQVADETAAAIADLFGSVEVTGPAAADERGGDPEPADDANGDDPPSARG